jgi:hypothetical protein
VTLNKREQKIAWVVGGVLGLYLLYAFVVTPLYLDPLRDTDTAIAAARQRQQKEQDLLNNRKKVQADWDKLIQAGLESDQTTAATHVYNSINRMLQMYRVQLVSGNFGALVENKKSDFSELPFGLRLNCTSSTLGSLLYSMETAGLPIRLDNVTIQSVKPGQDNLDAEIKIQILLYNPRQQSIKIAGTRPGTARPAVAAISPPEADEPPSKEVEDLAKKLRERRAREEAGLSGTAETPATPAHDSATQPGAAAPGVIKSADEIAAELRARRAREEAGDTAAVTPTTPTTQPSGGVR